MDTSHDDRRLTQSLAYIDTLEFCVKFCVSSPSDSGSCSLFSWFTILAPVASGNTTLHSGKREGERERKETMILLPGK